MLSRDQVHTILEGVAAQHAMKLDALAAFERRETQPAFDEHRYDSIINGLAHQLAASRGPSATFAPADAELLAAHDLPAVSGDHINRFLDELRHRRFLPTPRGKLEEIVARHDLEPTPSNLAQADTAYLLGLARALLDVDRHWPKFSAAAQEELQNSRAQHQDETKTARTEPDKSTAATPQPTPQHNTPPAVPEATTATQTTCAAAATVQVTGVILADAKSPIINDLAKELEKIKIKTTKWNEKSCKQAAQTFALFQRLVGVTDVRRVSQYTLAVFRDRLLSIPTTYDKSSANRDVPVDVLLALAEALPDDQVGLEPKTINRHLTFLNGLIRHSKSWGIELNPTIDISLLRMPDDSKEMDERIRFSHDDLETLFASPTWASSPIAASRATQNATYWVPILGYYTGARREELCGLAAADINFLGDQAWLDLRPNSFRNLKNAHSARQIPLHPEIIRLGFKAYCDRIGELGYDLLFPDLTPAAGDIPYGEQFYEQFKKILNQHLPRHQEESKSFHSFRHGFNIQLRKKKVFLELREELMGHKIGSQSADRYAEPFELDDKLEIVRLLEPITEALQPMPVRLSDAIESRLPVRRARKRGEASSSI